MNLTVELAHVPISLKLHTIFFIPSSTSCIRWLQKLIEANIRQSLAKSLTGKLELILLMTIIRGQLILDYTVAASTLPLRALSIYVGEIFMTLLHRRKRQNGQLAIQRIQIENMATGIKLVKGSCILPYDDCQMGKLARLSYPSRPFVQKEDRF